MKKCPYCAEEIQDEAAVCKHCGRDLRQQQPPPTVKRVKKTEMVGTGCVVQGVGVLLLVAGFFFGIVGVVVGVGLFLCCLIVGSGMSTVYLCGACRTKLPNKEARVCPACRAMQQ